MSLVPNRILLFTDWYEPGYKAGGPIQACRNIVELLKDRYEFFILTSDRDLGEIAPYPDIETDRWLPGGEGVHICYASRSFLSIKKLRHIFKEVQPQFVYFNSMFSFRYTLLPLWVMMRGRFSGKIILAPRGMLHKGAVQQKSLKKNLFLKAFKITGWQKRIEFQATDPQEQKDILFFFGHKTKTVVVSDIPNVYPNEWKSLQKKKGELRCVFISRITPKKNIDYLLERLGELDKQHQIVLDLYGLEEDPAYAGRCRKLIDSLGKQIQVSFRGPLPYRMVYDTLSGYHIFILPTLGENFGYAIMEALSAGKPALISDQTPWRGLEAKHAGWDIPLERPDQFTRALEQAANFDQEDYNQWSLDAWKYARDYGDRLNLSHEYFKLFQTDAHIRD
jgi:glycosyltransferase involved in cell wall biosynthesis